MSAFPPPKKFYAAILACMLLLLLTAGCNPITQAGQLDTASAAPLSQGSTLGQSFVAQHNGLNGVAFLLAPQTPGDGKVVFHLRSSSQSEQDEAAASLPLAQITSPAYYTFNFPARDDSQRHSYYAFLEIKGRGAVQLTTAAGSTYTEGAMYQNNSPVDAQAAFNLTYQPALAALGAVQEMAGWLKILLSAVFLFALPGWALMSLLWNGWKGMAWPEKLGLAVGSSLALYPVLFLLGDKLGLHPGAWYAWGVGGAAVLILAWQAYKNIHENIYEAARKPGIKTSFLVSWLPHNRLKDRLRKAFGLPEITLAILLGLILATRLWAIVPLEAPMWGDAYQHTVMAQLMLDQGGLFSSWLPYTPYNSLTVQYGFPALAAVYAWLTGAGSIQAVLVVGQLVNFAAILAIYPLATRLAKGSAWAGVSAVLVAGLLSPMPFFYINWGRYAQLAGQAVLPTALFMVWAVMEKPLCLPPDIKTLRVFKTLRVWVASNPFGEIFLAGLILAGMMLSYYRMPFYYATFVLAILVGWGLPRWKLSLKNWLSPALACLLVGAVAILIFSPWYLQMAGGKLAGAVESGVTGGRSIDRVLTDYRDWLKFFTYVPWPVLALSLLGFAWSVWKRDWPVASMLLWVASLSSIVAGALIRLPGANMMQSFAVLIALYIPAGLLGGWAISQIAHWLGGLQARRKLFGYAQVALAAALLLAGARAAWDQRGLANPSFFSLVTRPDSRAMAWIRKNTPPEARFLVEAFRTGGGATAVGADAGWWIPLLAGRENTMPPQYAILNEAPVEPDYTSRVVQLVTALETNPPGSPAGVQALCRWGITHVYIGQGQGQVSFGNAQLFTPQQLSESSLFNLAYHQDRVYIFTFNRQGCEAGQ